MKFPSLPARLQNRDGSTNVVSKLKGLGFPLQQCEEFTLYKAWVQDKGKSPTVETIAVSQDGKVYALDPSAYPWDVQKIRQFIEDCNSSILQHDQ